MKALATVAESVEKIRGDEMGAREREGHKEKKGNDKVGKGLNSQPRALSSEFQ